MRRRWGTRRVKRIGVKGERPEEQRREAMEHRPSGESAIETGRRCLLPGLYRRSVLHPAEARSGPHEVVGAFKDAGMPAIVVAIMRPIRRREVRGPTVHGDDRQAPGLDVKHSRAVSSGDPMFPIWPSLPCNPARFMACPLYENQR